MGLENRILEPTIPEKALQILGPALATFVLISVLGSVIPTEVSTFEDQYGPDGAPGKTELALGGAVVAGIAALMRSGRKNQPKVGSGPRAD